MYESGEMYLKTILILSKRNGTVKSVDIARELNFSKPSVSRATSILKKDEYINVDHKGFITLTDKGEECANYVFEKHIKLTEFLVSVAKVSPETAYEDACKIEHVISDETFEGIKRMLEQRNK